MSLLAVLLFCAVGCSAGEIDTSGEVNKVALASLLADFERIPKTLEQDALVTAYGELYQREDATQKEVNQAVSALVELKTVIFSTPMSFVDGGVEPHVRAALDIDDNTVITIGDCFSLERLDCSYDPSLGVKIRVSYDFRYFPNLRSLDLSGNALEDLNGFAYLSDLEVLNLSDNPARGSNLNEEDAEAEVRSFDVLSNLPLKELDLSGAGVLSSLRVLPEILTLETLNISENRLENLDGIGERFPRLKRLLASDCSVQQLSSLSDCVLLETLDLSRSQISDLGGIVTLQALDTLILDGVPLSDVSALTRLSGLSTLSLVSCGIEDLSWITDLAELEVLDLSENKIALCELSEGQTSVKRLDLTGNKITSFVLNEAFAHVVNLDLSENLLTTFSVELTGDDCQLKTLNLCNNALVTFLLGNCDSLSSLDLSGNKLATLSLQSESLASLNLSDNPLTDLSLSMPTLTTLFLNCKTVYKSVSLNLPALTSLEMDKSFSAPSDFLSSLTSLTEVVLNLSHKKALPVPLLPNLRELTLIGVSDSDITAMPVLENLQHLKILESSVVVPSFGGEMPLLSVSFRDCTKLADLSGLSIFTTLESISVEGGTLPAPQVSGLPNLKTLALNYCGVGDLSLVNGLPALESLSLVGNDLASVSVVGFSQLRNLDLSNNRIASSENLVLDLTKGTLNLSGNSETLYESLPSLPAAVTVIINSTTED